MENALILALLTAVAAFFGGYGVARATRTKGALRYRIRHIRNLIPPVPARIPLRWMHGDEPLKQLSIVHCCWLNRGNVPIEDVPFTWQEKTTTGRYLEWVAWPEQSISYESKGKTGKILSLNDSPPERAHCEWYFADDENPEVMIVNARGKGIVGTEDRLRSPFWYLIISSVGGGVVFLSFVAVALLTSAYEGELGRYALVVGGALIASALGVLSLTYVQYKFLRIGVREISEDLEE